ncbi:sensor histidine kinase [Legionella steigerwaltii]|uniref:histidine kinase n=1 Tax=Legionella steigerwaltii TaxID=460 RepID=A0A378LBY3_9GAMM|nr:ATP-binding protein [Legionella steigerwaltii]KTD78138.1 sensor histidine kinase [Legionella steigerwaltii]STY24333.1 sensor histidine kinase [Legionella steigerwaltii]
MESTNEPIDFKLIFESAPGLYLVLDEAFTIIAVSNNYLQATMVTREQIIGKNIFDVFPDNPEDPHATGVSNLSDSLNRVLKNKTHDIMAIQKYDVRRPREKGGGYEERYWSPINLPVFDIHKKIKYIIHRVEDVTEYIQLKKTRYEQLKAMEALSTRAGEMEVEIYQRAQEIQIINKKLQVANYNLASLDQLKTQFFANISHELRTPLTLILGSIDTLLRDKTLAPLQIKKMQLMKENALLLLKHVNDLLDIAKFDSGRLQINYYTVDFVCLIKKILSLFEADIEAKELHVSCSFPKKLFVQMDNEKIERVILNLLSNAIKFSPFHGTICLRLGKKNKNASFSIEDNGSGIPSELREKIFERFFQMEENMRHSAGTGLGLAIVKDFIELHNGTIKVQQSKLGGALFIIQIPLNAPADQFVHNEQPIQRALEIPRIVRQPRKIVTKQPNVESNPNRPLVLVVEDNLAMNEFLCELLSKDYRIVSARDGKEGLDKAITFHPHVIISDIMMPNMNGIEMVHAIRQHSSLLSTPVMIVTAKADDELCVRMLHEGAQDYMIKPFSTEEFKARIANLILVKNAEDELERFVYLASHDLKSPLPAIEHLVSWIEEDVGNQLTSQSRKYLTFLRKRAYRMSKLLDGLLKYAQAGGTHSKVEKINFPELVNSVAHSVEAANDFNISCKHCTFPIEAEKNSLQEVIYELIDNSVKHHHLPKGHIQVGVVEKNDYYEFFVADDGPGIELAYQDRIFQLFQTLQPRDVLETCGVGLSIAKKIVETQGGSIGVKSDKNQGAIFHFTWPKQIGGRLND